jgi:flagellar protein FliL
MGVLIESLLGSCHANKKSFRIATIGRYRAGHPAKVRGLKIEMRNQIRHCVPGVIALLAMIVCTSATMAQEDGELTPEQTAALLAELQMDASDPSAGMVGIIYYTLGASFVTNYDGSGRLKYLKTDVSVRIQPGTAPVLDRHLPYIRNRLIVLFSAQLEENLTSTDGRELLRLQALREVQSALTLLESEAVAQRVVNLYFTSFVVQR